MYRLSWFIYRSQSYSVQYICAHLYQILLLLFSSNNKYFYVKNIFKTFYSRLYNTYFPFYHRFIEIYKM